MSNVVMDRQAVAYSVRMSSMERDEYITASLKAAVAADEVESHTEYLLITARYVAEMADDGTTEWDVIREAVGE